MAVTLPFTFTNGTVADATQVNANFTALATTALVGDASGSVTLGTAFTPAPKANTLTAGQIAIQPSPPDNQAHLGLNIYMDAAGQYRYIANGAGAVMQPLQTSPAGPGARVNIAVANINTAGPGAVANLAGTMSIMYGPPHYVIIGDSSHIPTTFTPLEDSLICGDLLPGRVNIAWRLNLAGEPQGRLDFNMYADAGNQLRYLDNGPAYTIIAHSTSNSWEVRFSPPGTPGAALPSVDPLCGFIGQADVITEQTNFSLVVNRGGTVGYERVLLGPVNSGPGGAGRALYIPN